MTYLINIFGIILISIKWYNVSQLTEFHGELDTKLPPRSKFPFNKGLDTMQAKRKPFEEYVVGLLQKPELKGSEMLFTFLTSKQEFTEAASNLPGA